MSFLERLKMLFQKDYCNNCKKKIRKITGHLLRYECEEGNVDFFYCKDCRNLFKEN